MKLHPIQLKQLQYKQLNLEIFDFSVCESSSIDLDIGYQTGFNEYDNKTNELVVAFRCLIKDDCEKLKLEKTRFEIAVELLALFQVDEKNFPIEQVEHFARNNAPIILMPYIRENVYLLSSRAGINIILPLIQVPTASQTD